MLFRSASANDARTIATELKGQFAGSTAGLVIVLAPADGRVAIVVAANDAAIQAGHSSGALLSALAGMLDGRGGGKPELAQGSGSNVAAIPAALAAVDGILAAGA